MSFSDAGLTGIPPPYKSEAKPPNMPAASWLARRDWLIPKPDEQLKDVEPLEQRPATFNTTGSPAQVRLNAFPVVGYPTGNVWQYDVVIGSGNEKRGLISAVWQSQAMKKNLNHPSWIFDGNRLAWSLHDSPELRFHVDLDAEGGRTPRAGHPNNHRVSIRKSKKIDLSIIHLYLTNKTSFSKELLEAISFLDHLLRETPSKNMISLKRSFFSRDVAGRVSLGQAVMAMKGIYQTLRLGQNGQLYVNVDVANATFWGHFRLHSIAASIAGVSETSLGGRLKKTQKADQKWYHGLEFAKVQNRMKKLKFTIRHRGNTATKKTVFTVNSVSEKNAREWKFDLVDRATGQVRKNTSIEEYFKMKYNILLEHPTLPILETTKKGIAFPMEVCEVVHDQRYPFKLDEDQTAKMIKFAVTRPAERKAGVMGGVNQLGWAADPFLKNYGLKVDSNMLLTKAQLLTPPTIEFGGGKIERPGTAGRWRLDGKRFYRLPAAAEPSRPDLERWGVCIINEVGFTNGQISGQVAKSFIEDFIKIYKSHGAKVAPAFPIFHGHQGSDTGAAVTQLFEKCKAAYGEHNTPQLLIFFINGKNSYNYNRIKKSCECRYGVMSQVMQTIHVPKKAPQYISNVLMKVNSKLGGVTARAVNTTKLKKAQSFNLYLEEPTVIIGADVSHAAPGSLQASMAAMTCSIDKDCTRYAAGADTNGHRVETISNYCMQEILNPMLKNWMTSVGQGGAPKRVIYFRDGVSEGQYGPLLAGEVAALRDIFKQLAPKTFEQIKFTIIVVSKRHHIRFWPQGAPAADKNGNPCPGVLVERDVTSPFEYDFYLNSHSAIQGTARPTHYHVLRDEAKYPPAQLQNMIYEHCYQYQRSTTPVSIHPAVYYAHLASKRAVSHENVASAKGPHKSTEEFKYKQRRESLRAAEKLASEYGQKFEMPAERPLTEFLPLLKIFQSTARIDYGMWYI
ncbi:hypothetical protein MMC25_004675 [Agyrium rufum]|nr:hypothetical protein [Agyrium rufum]